MKNDGSSRRREELAAELRRMVAPLPRDLEAAPEKALDRARGVAKWILQEIYREQGEEPGELRYPELFQADREALPHRIRIQLQTIQHYGTAEERADEGSSDITRADVLPCLQALDNVVQWFWSTHFAEEEPPQVLSSSGTPSTPPTDAPSRDWDPLLMPAPLEPPRRRPLALGVGLLLVSLCILGVYWLQVEAMKRYSDRRIGFVLEQNPDGILISGVEPMGPADRGGLQPEDVMVEVDGHPVVRLNDFQIPAQFFQRGKPVEIRFLRQGREMAVQVEPGLAADWTQPALIGFSMLVCLVFGVLGLYQRPHDLRSRLLGTFLLMVAAELSTSVGWIPFRWLDTLADALYYVLTGGEIAVTLHLAALIPERQPWLRRSPWFIPSFYGVGALIAVMGGAAYVLEDADGTSFLPWTSLAISRLLNEVGLPLWGSSLLWILIRPALWFPEPQGRLQARLACFGLLPWLVGYLLPLALYRLAGQPSPRWLEDIVPIIVLFFPAAIATVILLEARNHRKILLNLAQEIRHLDSVQEMAELVAADVEAAFHPRSLYVFFQRDATEELSLGHSTGVHSQVQRIPHHFEVTRRAEGSGRILFFPRDLSDLPEDEKEWLVGLQTRLIVPVNDSRRDLVGLLLLGNKRSEEWYNPSDLRLLHALAGQIALSFENLGLQSRLGEKTRVQREVLARLQDREINLTRECPVCGRCYDSEIEECPRDGAEVVLAVPVERVIGERYRLDRVLGKGGVGSVYQAHDLRLNRPVAVKVLLGSALDNPLAQRRFEREARVVAQLDHPNIVTVHDFGSTEVGNAFIVLEFLEGITLRSALKHRGAIDPIDLAAWVGQILDGLQAAHRNGVIHRDLKPGNVFITQKKGRDELVKLLDFGIAKTKTQPDYEAAHLTLPGVILGTLGYMAPEQVLGHEVDERADLYSVGVMVLEALRGQRPFHGKTPVEVMGSLTGQPKELAPDYGDRIVEIVERCLARDPDHRYGSAAGLQVDLVAALRACPRPSRVLDSRGAAFELPTTDSTAPEVGLQRGPTEKVDLTGQMEAYLKGLRSELKGRNNRS